ncbi:MAG: hypothetical protein NVS1B11_31520 [Terriglobales bacterium]
MALICCHPCLQLQLPTDQLAGVEMSHSLILLQLSQFVAELAVGTANYTHPVIPGSNRKMSG